MCCSKYLRFAVFLCACIMWSQGFAEEVPKKSNGVSTVELIKLLNVEDELVENLMDYLEILKNKLLLMEKSLITMNAEHTEMKTDYEAYLGNPLNSFRLIHRLNSDWSKWHDYALRTNKDTSVHMEKAHDIRKRLPTAFDFEIACRGIDDLMCFYNLKPDDLAAGNLAAYSKPETALSAQDCLSLGEFSIRHRKEDLAEAWFNTSLARFTEDKLSYKALKFSRNTVHKAWGLLLMKNKQLTEASYHIDRGPRAPISPNSVDYYFQVELATQRNCSAVYRRPSRLHCRYNSSTTAFTRIAPLKMEELSTDPYMVVFHDVLYDSEIESMLNPSEFVSSLVDGDQKSDVRTSKDSYVDDVDKLEYRVADLTGLSMEMSDAFSLINYGLGGHYISHYDYFNMENQIRQRQGDRLATVLFYLGEVESGGSTIFPMINVSVTPKKGSALLWYNLHNSGDMNLKTLHSACPVISGSKYVLTKWINELPQMFTTPCMKNANLHTDKSIVSL
ncbi:prolyl 4-hydroxylase subunit alpha-1-like [Drosophila biarmipes]|uniref:prolyl 4-hydroxylase subunit alpha-1-like n=1 Tax=Drosophila biarmipes TaxID=125945 RepID=UPI0007E8449D|nr:prolyl 4-hydroxylase subunit alpha-1-like [Drosophila biarmipes]